MHGRGVAKYLAETTNKLTQEKNAYAYDMDLSMDTRKAMEELEEIIVTIDEGGGVIVIYDMGSFGTMLDMIAERTNIKIRGINMPVTTAGVEVARRCARESDIDRIYHLVNQEIQQLIYPKEQWKKIIITLCHTAEGGATQLKQYIDQYSKLNMRTIALAVADKDKLIQEVMELKKNYEIHAFVGTFDPELFGIPFIPISDIFESDKIDIDRVLMFEPVNKTRVGYDEVIANFENELHYVSADKLRKILPGCVEELAAVYHLQENEKIGFFAHMVSLLEYLASPDYVCKNNGAETIVAQRKEDYLFVSKVLKRLERQFKVIINDTEMGIILQTLTRENKTA
jgi:transcriptional regulatory protein LevR